MMAPLFESQSILFKGGLIGEDGLFTQTKEQIKKNKHASNKKEKKVYFLIFLCR